MKRSARQLRRWINFYPPFLGAGIRVKHISDDYREMDVEMKLRWWNRNYVGTHYGGSLFSMTDACYMIMLLNNMGREYIIWDKTATIRYRKPGRNTVRAEFRLSQEQLDGFRAQLVSREKIEPTLTVLVRDEAGETIAEVDKLIYIRKKA